MTEETVIAELLRERDELKRRLDKTLEFLTEHGRGNPVIAAIVYSVRDEVEGGEE